MAVKPRGSDNTGAIIDGYLRIRACLAEAIYSLGYSNKQYISIGPCATVQAQLHVDCLNTGLVEGALLHYFPLSSFISYNDVEKIPEVFLICLEQIPGVGTPRYRRIGWSELQGRDCLSGLGLRPDEEGLMVLNSEQCLSEITII